MSGLKPAATCGATVSLEKQKGLRSAMMKLNGLKSPPRGRVVPDTLPGSILDG
jgi:hypothetical protein